MSLELRENKPLPKHTIEYWSKRVESEFESKLVIHETNNHDYIHKAAQENIKTFYKGIGIEEESKDMVKTYKAIKKLIKEYEDNAKIVKSKLLNISKIRSWNMPEFYPTVVRHFNFMHVDVKEYLEQQCLEESRKAFYNSKKGKSIKELNESKEAILDSLYSGNMSEETLNFIRTHFLKNGINPNGILNNSKSIEGK